MILSHKAIKLALQQGKLQITPLSEENIDTAHIDLHLKLPNKDKLVIPRKGFTLPRTLERVTLSNDLCSFIEGRAALAKQGISVEQSSTFIEPGTNNYMTLELFNASDEAKILHNGELIAKMYLSKVLDQL